MNGTPKKWKKSKVNRALLRDLYQLYGQKEFTNQDAYKVYNVRLLARPHKSWWEQQKASTGQIVEDWQEMSVRNTLCSTTYHRPDILKRIQPGQYQFVGTDEEVRVYLKI